MVRRFNKSASTFNQTKKSLFNQKYKAKLTYNDKILAMKKNNDKFFNTTNNFY